MLDMQRGERLAVKVMEARRRMERDQALAETEILAVIERDIRHPHLMAPRRVYVEGNRIWIMFPLCRGGDLFHRLVTNGRGPESEAAAIVARLLSAVRALHEHGILHLDLKPENVLFPTEEDPTHVVLTDFGLSRKMHPSRRRGSRNSTEEQAEEDEEEGEKEEEEEEEEDQDYDLDYLSRLRYNLAFDEKINGTIGYMAPEVVLHKRYAPAADVWGLGVVLHILLVGYAPFQGNSHEQQQKQQQQQQQQAVLAAGGDCDADGSTSSLQSSHQEALDRSVRGEFVMDELDWARVSAPAKDLVRRMLTVEDDARITTEEALEHPWLHGHTDLHHSALPAPPLGRGDQGSATAAAAAAATAAPKDHQGRGPGRKEASAAASLSVPSSFREMLDTVMVHGSSFISSFTTPAAAPGVGTEPCSSSSSSSSSSMASS